MQKLLMGKTLLIDPAEKNDQKSHQLVRVTYFWPANLRKLFGLDVPLQVQIQ